MEIMLDMIMEKLGPLADKRAADHETVRSEALAYVAKLTGKDTVHQMQAFADHEAALGGEPDTAQNYKAEFLRRLEQVRSARLNALQAGERSRESLLVPGSTAILAELQARGVELYLSSGTDHRALIFEAGLLGLTPFFGERILGAGPGGSTKADLLARIVAEGTTPADIVFFGDGPVEIEATREIGGVAVGMATDEPECQTVHPKKREWLITAGADFIVPNYLPAGLLEAVIPTHAN